MKYFRVVLNRNRTCLLYTSHAELDTIIRGGTILVEKSNEGLEGKRVVVNGGDITVNASDDGINACLFYTSQSSPDR